ncbi:MAG: rhamnogalacturonan acetylesterase [Pedobacter sp.]|nr:MAG: rhamnogalacturonan acetylesterase [Pedobacter sp.]
MLKDFFLGLAIVFFSVSAPQRKTTIYIIGDSTAANKIPKAFPEMGWGMKLQSNFDDQIQVDNRALNGRSTKSFLAEKRWDAVLSTLQEGDYVFIQFGHNDEKIDRPAVGTSLDEYKANLVKYIEDTKAKNAYPVLLTPIMRRNFKDGVFVDTHQGYPDVVRKVADSLQVPLIDMHQKTEKLILGMGEVPSIKLFNHVAVGHENYPEGKIDNTHLSAEGADAVASLVIEGIKEAKLSLSTNLKKGK